MKTRNENLQKAIYEKCATCDWYSDSLYALGCTQSNDSKEECEEMEDYVSIQEATERRKASKNIRYNHETSQQYMID